MSGSIGTYTTGFQYPDGSFVEVCVFERDGEIYASDCGEAVRLCVTTLGIGNDLLEYAKPMLENMKTELDGIAVASRLRKEVDDVQEEEEYEDEEDYDDENLLVHRVAQASVMLCASMYSLAEYIKRQGSSGGRDVGTVR